MSQEDFVTRIWHAVLAAFALVGVGGQTVLVFTEDGRSLLNLFSYFTIESNLLVLIAAVAIAIRPEREGSGWAILRLAGLAGITVTGIVYATVLAGTAEFVGSAWWYDNILHYVVPAGAMLGFFLFTPRTRFARSDLAFIAWPIAWLAYTLIRGGVSDPGFPGANGTTSSYPYDFLDVDGHGAGGVTVAALVVTVLMLGIAALYVRFSRR